MQKDIREKIIQQARKLFNEYGYHEVTMRKIADACQISVGNLTYYYPHKKDILRDLLWNTHPRENTYTFNSLNDLYDFLYEMIDGIRKNHFFFSSSQLQDLDEDFYFANKKNVQDLKNIYSHALLSFRKKGLIKRSVTYEEITAFVEMTMLAHLSWANEEDKNSTYTDLSFQEFLWKHMILLYPFLAAKGIQEFEHIKTDRD